MLTCRMAFLHLGSDAGVQCKDPGPLTSTDFSRPALVLGSRATGTIQMQSWLRRDQTRSRGANKVGQVL